ncbi:PAS domain-containing protein [Naasia sp. SYSU D00057]|uniref:PAS domain-containing protein n=1 Tax=Naasia sp. SYSU D00057 TaxID=2817380 RepID=UPI001B304C07|nr:PAS domain-containing protein [Naasia sp. SYSU D00057]
MKAAQLSAAPAAELAARAARLLGAAAWSYDADSGIFRTSGSFTTVFGEGDESAAVLSETLALLPEPQRSVLRLSLEHCLSTGEPFDFTTALGGPTGRERQVRYVGEAVRDEDGEVTGAAGAVHDVTPILAQASSRDILEEHVRSRLDQMPTGMAFLGPDWRFTYINESAQRYLQRPGAVLLGGVLWELFPEIEGTAFGIAYRRAMEDRVVASVRGYFAPIAMWFLVTAYPVGEGIGFHVQDVTDDQRNVERLEESAGRLRAQAALLDAARDAMHVRTLEGEILYWNAGAERVYGWAAESMVGRTVCGLVAADRSAYDAAMETTLRTGHWSGELAMRTRDGRTILVDCRWQLTSAEDGHVSAVFAVESDITEMRHAEQERYRAQRMESLGVLAGGIAHDLNNVLTPVLLSAQLLGDSVRDPQEVELLGSIEAGARRGADLIRQVLLFARGEEAERRVLDVDSLLAELADFCRKTAPRSIDVEFLAPSRPLRVTADRTQLMQVLVNLVTNAVDAMPGGGALTIGAAPVDGGRGRVGFTVEDTGHGMDAEVCGRIFEPFYSTKGPGRGTGLGLPTSLAIARRHDGGIDVVSAPGRGSRFTLWLPAADAPADSGEGIRPTPQEAPAGAGLLVLVVDDEEPVRDAVRRVLETHGYRTVEAADGRAGLELLERCEASGDPVAAVVIDLMMPVLGGANTLDRIRSERPELPVILTSGFDPSAGNESRPADAAVRFLRKPFAEAELLGLLGELRSRRRVLL